MALFKCKMCGGALEIKNHETVAICEYCGTQQTLPKLNDDRRTNLYDRANHFRRNNEFDKAMAIYEKILNEDNGDAEAYWSLVLCRYGIEYVEDPATRKRLPTVNRAQFTSVFDDDNYKSALQYADGFQRALYEQEAKAINEIQKGILSISQKEEPFDIFICYKETDNNGRRTPDSVLATDLYHQLKQEGFKVFFSRITLEDKLGSAYEPYIFAALNSAKVMVVLGTKPEYFNAVWVKNEWSRYLSLIKQGKQKMLIPAYRDMDPYDLPEEFSHLQAQDMSKLGFMQDLIRGIKKIVTVDAPAPVLQNQSFTPTENTYVAPLLKRAFLFLEDKDWASAKEYFEKVLDVDPECAEAYLGELMVELNVSTREELKKYRMPFDNRNNYQKALRFGDENFKKELQGYIDAITTRNINTTYNNAIQGMEIAKTVKEFKELAAIFTRLRDFKDAEAYAKQCRDKAEDIRLGALYTDARLTMESATTFKKYEEAGEKFKAISHYKDAAEKAEECFKLSEEERQDSIYRKALAVFKGTPTVDQYKRAIRILEDIPHWKDTDERIDTYWKKLRELQENEKIALKEQEQQKERERIAAEKKRKRTILTRNIILLSIVLIITLIIIFFAYILPEMNYKKALAYVENGQYFEAISVFEDLDGYKDSYDKTKSTQYLLASEHMKNKEYKAAYDIFAELNQYDSYRDCGKKAIECGLLHAQALYDNKDYEGALAMLAKENFGEEGVKLVNKCYLEQAKKLHAKKMYAEAIEWYEKIPNYDKKAKLYLDCCYNYGKQQINAGNYSAAITLLQSVGNYSDAKNQINAAKYGYVKANKNAGNETTFKYLKELKSIGYKDSSAIYKSLYAWNVKLLWCNNYSNNTSTKISSIPKSTRYLHMGFELTGGTPSERINVSHTVTWPGSYKQVSDWTWDDVANGSSLSFEYSEGTNSSAGTMTIEFYNAKTKQFIGRITYPVG